MAAVAVFVTWMILDYVLHGVLLTSVYAQSPQLWRPMAEYKMALSAIVVLVNAACFAYIYAQFITEKSVKAALTYGLVLGIARGITMGYGSYSAMPMPYMLALAWFLGSVVEYVIAGGVLSLIVKPEIARRKKR
jgi:hypothetical protein